MEGKGDHCQKVANGRFPSTTRWIRIAIKQCCKKFSRLFSFRMSSYQSFEGTPMSWLYFTCFWVSRRSSIFVASTMNNFLNEKDQEKTNAKQNLSQVFLLWEWNFQQLSYLFNGNNINWKLWWNQFYCFQGCKFYHTSGNMCKRLSPKRIPPPKQRRHEVIFWCLGFDEFAIFPILLGMSPSITGTMPVRNMTTTLVPTKPMACFISLLLSTWNETHEW